MAEVIRNRPDISCWVIENALGLTATRSAVRSSWVRYAALFIGVNETPGGSSLNFAESDAKRMARLLTSNLAFGTAANTILLLGANATRAAVRHALGKIRRAAPDCVLVFFSGHGSPRGIALANGLLSYDELAARLAGVGATRPTVIIDACSAGAAFQPFLVRIGGVGGLDDGAADAWLMALEASAPGLRIFAAVADGEGTFEDRSLGAGRFSWCLERALRFGKGRAFGTYALVTDVDAFEQASAEHVGRWPGDARPLLFGPPSGEPLPLVLAQSVHVVGSGSIDAVVASRSAALSVTVTTRGRQFVATFLCVQVFDITGHRLGSAKRVLCPMRTVNRCNEVFSLDWPALSASNDVFAAAVFGQPFGLTWRVALTDDFGRVLASTALQRLHAAA